jgi:hypothetical protein
MPFRLCKALGYKDAELFLLSEESREGGRERSQIRLVHDLPFAKIGNAGLGKRAAGVGFGPCEGAHQYISCRILAIASLSRS